MSEHNLPKAPSPLSPWKYWQESLRVWSDFSQQTSKIMMRQFGGGSDTSKKLDADTETLATELLRTLSDVNLRHWQNTAQLLESYPAWLQVPQSMTGTALVDWFDNLQRTTGNKLQVAPAESVELQSGAELRPRALPVPDGKADDLTRIKGIGPKLSKRLNEVGIFHFKQIAGWSDEEASWVDDHLSYKGRVAREAWVSQARILSANGTATVH